jgi:manganese efflux pump family protein
VAATFSILVLAFALAADAFAAALARGVSVRTNVVQAALATGLAFGIAQAIAPLIGWGAIALFGDLVAAIDHWIAFALLAFLGWKLLREGLDDLKDPGGPADDPLPAEIKGPRRLILLAVATSIDAAAAGATLPALGAPVLVSAAVIGLVTGVLSAAGVVIGRQGGRMLGSYAEIVGGLALIGIGVNVLIEHRAFG